MDKDQWLTAVVLAVTLIGIPMGVLVLVCRSNQPKDRNSSDSDNYPDDHLFV